VAAVAAGGGAGGAGGAVGSEREEWGEFPGAQFEDYPSLPYPLLMAHPYLPFFFGRESQVKIDVQFQLARRLASSFSSLFVSIGRRRRAKCGTFSTDAEGSSSTSGSTVVRSSNPTGGTQMFGVFSDSWDVPLPVGVRAKILARSGTKD